MLTLETSFCAVSCDWRLHHVWSQCLEKKMLLCDAPWQVHRSGRPVILLTVSSPLLQCSATDLMPHIKDEFVLWRIEDIVQGHCEVSDSKTGPQMPSSAADIVNDVLP